MKKLSYCVGKDDDLIDEDILFRLFCIRAWLQSCRKQLKRRMGWVLTHCDRSKGDFVTTSGEKGYKLVWAIKSQNGSQYVTNNYLFHGKGDTQVQLSGTIDAANADKFAPIFDSFAKSFTLIESK